MTDLQTSKSMAHLSIAELRGLYDDWPLIEEIERLRNQLTQCHPDPTGKNREPPHCPSCSCGTPAEDRRDA